MDVSIKDVSKELYPLLKQIGFDGVDIKLPNWDKRD